MMPKNSWKKYKIKKKKKQKIAEIF